MHDWTEIFTVPSVSGVVPLIAGSAERASRAEAPVTSTIARTSTTARTSTSTLAIGGDRYGAGWRVWPKAGRVCDMSGAFRRRDGARSCAAASYRYHHDSYPTSPGNE